jgi:hypothetical protein
MHADTHSLVAQHVNVVETVPYYCYFLHRYAVEGAVGPVDA